METTGQLLREENVNLMLLDQLGLRSKKLIEKIEDARKRPTGTNQNSTRNTGDTEQRTTSAEYNY